MKFRKRPIVIEAVNVKDILAFAQREWGRLPDWLKVQYENGHVLFRSGSIDVVTLEGAMTANPDDWIIQGVNGEIYPCKPDIFEKTYEAVND